jgi:hypothetical protein
VVLPAVRAEAVGVNDAEKRADLARKRRERQRSPQTYITWLPEKVRLVTGKRIFVVGVASDCDPQVARLYGVRL